MKNQNLDELIIIGGARGVGKTTLAKEFFKRTQGSYVHPGDQFIKYQYSGEPRINESKIIEGLALAEILKAPKPIIVDLHYRAYSKFEGWVNGFCMDALKVLASNYDKVKLYLIDLDENTLYDRRMNDQDRIEKRRKLDKNIIKEELEQNRAGYEFFIKTISPITCVEAKIIINKDFNTALDELIQCAQE
ncbi:hypothetical protein COV11_00115 [Candidatus Woesearchaeota archaeon CG10_big_fil_rev_8_21_14_0_10_30_7]|nr:MAG: hypothetical protein COV11_00115 [Candidatus Woesearchaeota archaeon CG10_big_fil_rev_8_21_14_0_10_30_7]